MRFSLTWCVVLLGLATGPSAFAQDGAPLAPLVVEQIRATGGEAVANTDDVAEFQGAERLVNKLVQLGKPFDLMVYPHRSPAISEGEGTTLHVYSRIARDLLEQVDGLSIQKSDGSR